MKILQSFLTSEYDNETVLIHNGKAVTFMELKKLILAQAAELKKSEINNVVLLNEECYGFVVNFFASLIAQKDIYLLSDKNRQKQLDFEYILPDDITALSDNYTEVSKIKLVSNINFFTSGSTAAPKIIKKNFDNLIAEAKDLTKEFKDFFHNDYVFLSTANMTHMFGMTFHLIFAFYNGLVIDTEKIDYPEELDKKDYKNYVFITTPSFLEKIKKYDYSFTIHPKIMITAGAKLKDDVFKYFEKKSDIIEIYGSTETGVMAYRTDSMQKSLKKFPNVEIQTFDNKLKIKSQYFMEEEILLNDSAEFTDKNHFIIKERSDRMVKIQEKRVSLPEIESILQKSEYVEISYCLKIDDKIGACIILNAAGKKQFLEKGNTSLINELKNLVKEYSQIIPKRWRFLYELPLNENGKIDAVKIKEIFETNLSYPFIINKEINPYDTRLELLFPSSSNFFNGHFTNLPILAGVVQLYYAGEFIKDIYKVDLKPDEVKRVKFSSVIRPDERIILSIKKNEKSIEYSYSNTEKTFSSGSFVL